MDKKKYYITTAIAYTSGKPHIGNTYEAVLADSIARFKRQQGYDVFFQTGTDEHGQKIELKAAEAGVTCKEFVDSVAGEIKNIWDLMNTSYDKFIRTTDEDHEKQVQKIFKKLYDQGDIYKGYYEGMYCTPCESFFTESQLVDIGNCFLLTKKEESKMDKKKYYITTAIAYTSGKPHIGNTYEAVLADSIARFKRQQGYDVFFQTGTDEHGQKIELKAAEAGVTCKEFVDSVAGEIKNIWDLMNTSYDKFIRTTDEDHEKQVQKIFKKLYDQGDIYKGYYEGMYCTPCESFFTESQLVDGKCPDCGRPVTPAKEEAYFFRMSKYAQRLIDHINEHPEFIQPVSRKNEMMNNFLLPGLQDLCVSRTSFKWGIPVDFDPKHVVYVWLDALTNYITGIGYDFLLPGLQDLCVSRTSFKWGIPVDFDPKHVVYVWLDALTNYITGIGYDCDGESTEQFKKDWPADLHLIGKDIIRFHTIYWPIFLMALDLPLPKQVFGHPWLLQGDGKMSKSKGNVLYADQLVDFFGVDAVRYFVLHEMPFENDGHPWLLQGDGKMSKSKGNVLYADQLVDFFGVDAVRYFVLHEMPFENDGVITWELMVERLNSELANTLGNLVNRTISMSNKYFDGVVKSTGVCEPVDEELKAVVLGTKAKVAAKMEELRVADAITEIFTAITEIFTLFKRCNKYIDETMPWALAKDEDKKDRLAEVLYNLVEGICIGASLLESFMPDTTGKILAQLNANKRTYEELDTFGLYPSGNKVTEKPEILFARLDVKEVMAGKILAQLNANKRTYEELDTFGLYPSGNKVTEKPEILFARLDVKEVMEKVEEMRAQDAQPEEEKEEAPVVDIEAKPEVTFDEILFARLDVKEVMEKVEEMRAQDAQPEEEKEEAPVVDIEAKPEVTFDDFMKMQFQVGEIIALKQNQK